MMSYFGLMIATFALLFGTGYADDQVAPNEEMTEEVAVVEEEAAVEDEIAAVEDEVAIEEETASSDEVAVAE